MEFLKGNVAIIAVLVGIMFAFGCAKYRDKIDKYIPSPDTLFGDVVTAGDMAGYISNAVMLIGGDIERDFAVIVHNLNDEFSPVLGGLDATELSSYAEKLSNLGGDSEKNKNIRKIQASINLAMLVHKKNLGVSSLVGNNLEVWLMLAAKTFEILAERFPETLPGPVI